jgi:hypothetical protein
MRIAKAVIFIFVGALAGFAAGASMPPASAEALQTPGAGTRLVITQAGGAQTPSNIPTQALYFIKDTKSGGCWLGSAGVGGGIALTPAPKEACE